MGGTNSNTRVCFRFIMLYLHLWNVQCVHYVETRNGDVCFMLHPFGHEMIEAIICKSIDTHGHGIPHHGLTICKIRRHSLTNCKRQKGNKGNGQQFLIGGLILETIPDFFRGSLAASVSSARTEFGFFCCDSHVVF